MKLLLDRLIDYATQHALFVPGQRVGVAVSGGADSVFLLHALHELAPRWNLHLSVVHLDHGIRGAASVEDVAFVEALAGQYGLPFHFHQAKVLATDGNLEQEARRARHAFFQQLIHDRELDRVATGHTRSDQAETVLYRILRGSGLTGLAGILPVTVEGLVRPLLALNRQEVRAWLIERGHTWREDVTNQDLSFLRNKIRLETLPNLEADFNPQLQEALANLATLAQGEEAYWNQIVPKLARGPVVILNTTDVARQPALGRRLLRRAISQVKGDLRQIEFGHVERLLEMASQLEAGHDRAILPGIDALRSFDLLRIAPLGYDKSRVRDYSFPLDSAELETGELIAGSVTLRLVQNAADMDHDVQPCATVKETIDWQRLISLQNEEGKPPSLELRNWKPGDQYRRVGREHREKIKQMFQDFRIPLWERHEWPILTAASGTIVWAKKFGPAAELAADGSSRLLLSVRETGESGRGLLTS